MLTRLPRCSLVPALPLEEARSTLGCLFRPGSTVTGRKPRHHCCRCGEEVLARTHASSAWPSSLHRRAWCPLNVMSRVWWAHRRGTTLMSASLTCVSFSRCIRRVSAFASDVNVSTHSTMSSGIRPIGTGCGSSPASFPIRSTSALARDVVV